MPVAAGADNIRDAFNPLGRTDPLETASLLAAAAHLTPAQALTAVTADAWTRARPGLLPPSGAGAPARFVAVATDTDGGARPPATPSPRRRRTGSSSAAPG